MKKISYTTKSRTELTAELASLRLQMHAVSSKSQRDTNTTEYRLNRKNVARVLTAMNALTSRDSTEVEK